MLILVLHLVCLLIVNPLCARPQSARPFSHQPPRISPLAPVQCPPPSSFLLPSKGGKHPLPCLVPFCSNSLPSSATDLQSDCDAGKHDCQQWLFLCRARVRSEADLAGLQPAPDMGSLTPRLDLVIKHMTGMKCEAMRQLAACEVTVTVLEAVSEKSYVPIFHSSFNSEEAKEGSAVASHSADLLIG